MPDRLIKVFSAFTGNQGGRRDQLSCPQPGPGWILVALISFGLALLGCGGPSQQALTSQTLPQVQAPNPNQELQQQLMAQVAAIPKNSYRDYMVGPEDLLTISIFGQEKLDRELRVNGQGEITMPLVNVVKVAGLTPQEIEKRLKGLYDADFLVNSQVTVNVKEFRHQRVAITGAVDKPGSYELIGPRTLLEALSMAGGFSNKTGGPQAGDVINVIRRQNDTDLKTRARQPFTPTTETMVIDIRRLVSGQAPELNISVRGGDVIHVPYAGTAFVLGGVKKPGNIAVKENLTVSQVVAMGGGIDPIIGTKNITILRFDEQGKPNNISTNLDSIVAGRDPDFPIKNNDVVVVKESSLKKTLYIIRQLVPIPSYGFSSL